MIPAALIAAGEARFEFLTPQTRFRAASCGDAGGEAFSYQQTRMRVGSKGSRFAEPKGGCDVGP